MYHLCDLSKTKASYLLFLSNKVTFRLRLKSRDSLHEHRI